ncbi:UBP1-associated proteins 1C [Vigna unguiculata]|uniref:ESF2/ABP1 family protein n=1 Tax=Vigna unguiculata TaxID=3917 RepID=A0A4D6KUH6_VIGUN|nr:UBP1-associated proteins 1C [Vigna unguiculata]QCD80263.1 ESF2/ABP1 family protein [Vigna unguiculata]
MVWFQCEDCGDNLKKPKLSSHFRTCSAYKLSCIDCGEIFGRDTVQDHTQCITEAEKYGPKGQGKTLSAATATPNKDNKQRPEVDTNVGLSEQPPWFCSLCNTTTTSKQTLLLHADGKKHRAKARAFHASKQQPVQADKSVTDDAKTVVETGPNDKVRDESNVEVPKLKESSTQNDSKPGNETSAKKKRKLEALGDGKSVDLVKKSRNGTSVDMGNGEVIQGEKTTGEGNLKKEGMLEPHSTSTVENKIKWRKLLRSAFKSHPDGILKMKKLRKVVLKALQKSGIAMDEAELSKALEQKINASCRYAVENKYVRLVPKD